MIDNEAFPHQPSDRDAVLEERVHPGIGVRIVGRCGPVNRVAAGVCSHGHDAHAIGEAPVDCLQAFVIESLLQQDGRDRVNEFLV